MPPSSLSPICGTKTAITSVEISVPFPISRTAARAGAIQLEGEVRLDVTDHWAFGAGVRYWYAQTNGDSDFINLGVTTELQDFTSERFGVFSNVTYRFSTY